MIKRFIEVLSHDQKPWRRIAAKVIARSRLGQLLRIQIQIQDYAIFFHPTALSTIFWYDASARSEDSGFIKSFLRPGETYIDIGANIGVTVIPAAIKVGASGKVIAFEPHPKTASYLAENIALNRLKNIEIKNCALGDTRGQIFFTNKSSDDMNQVIFDQQTGIEVPIMLLDDFASEHEQIALLKLDVEGYEKFVLAGATNILSKVSCMYFEVDQQNFQSFGYNCQELLQQVQDLGFSLWRRNGLEPEIEPIDIASFLPPTTGYENIFGLRNIEDFAARTNWLIRQVVLT